jgi:hypothetical protein
LFFFFFVERDPFFKTNRIYYYPSEMGKLIAVDVKQLKGWEVKASLHHSVKDNGYAVTITCNEGEHYNSRQVRS